MTTQRPPRQPEQVRARLIDAAASLLAQGLPVSIGAIAVAAGVSKGALQHHFGTREELFAAMYEAYMAEFKETAAATGPGIPAALSYARATLELPVSGSETANWRALLVACVVDRGLAARWSEWVAAERKKDPRADEGPDTRASATSLLVRLAADGLWLSDVLGVYAIDDDERHALKSLIEELLTKKEKTP
jgi:AcrR family transcriptional regulator